MNDEILCAVLVTVYRHPSDTDWILRALFTPDEVLEYLDMNKMHGYRYEFDFIPFFEPKKFCPQKPTSIF